MRGYCGSFDDENYPKRLQDKFGNRWNIKVLVQVRRDAQENERGKLTERAEKYMGVRTITEPAVDIRKATKVVQLFFQAIPGGKTLVVEADTPVDVPRFRMARADQFERSWHLAAWVPNDPEALLS